MAQETMRERTFFITIVSVLWLASVAFLSDASAAELIKQRQATPQEKQIVQLEQELQVLRQKYEAQQMAIDNVSNTLRAQEAPLLALRDEGKKQTQLLTRPLEITILKSQTG